MLERKQLFNEELKNVFFSLKSRYDDISSNVIKNVSEEMFGVSKHVFNLSVNQGVLLENMRIAC